MRKGWRRGKDKEREKCRRKGSNEGEEEKEGRDGEKNREVVMIYPCTGLSTGHGPLWGEGGHWWV